MGSGPSSAVSSATPPDIGPRTTFEASHELDGFPTLPSNAPSSYHGLSIGLGSAMPGQGSSGHGSRSNEQAPDHFAGRFGPHMGSHPPFAGASGFRQPMSFSAPSPNNHSGYWHQHAMASPGDYAPFPNDLTTTSSTAPNPYAFTHQPTSMMWPPSNQHQQTQHQPVRSMSYGQIEGFGQNVSSYGDLHLGGLQQPAHLRQNPPTLEMQNASMMAQAPAPHSAPIAQHAQSFMDQQNAFGLQHSPFQQTGAPPSSTQSYSGTYYNTSPQLGVSQEERPESPGGTHSYIHHPSRPR
jgi:hypothetical protein